MIFGAGETMMAPMLPVITNALASDEVRGRYNAVGAMIFGVSVVVGPLTAGPLIGTGHATVWVSAVTVGALGAAGLALWLRQILTAAQDGREPEPVPGLPTPQAVRV
jgi:MFS family permease